jgi:ABC-2 type transport system ATP-binding protein
MITVTTTPPITGVRVFDVAQSYGTTHAVRGVDLAITPGETVARLGPNGAGKSTTIDMMLGLSRPVEATSSCSADRRPTPSRTEPSA